MGRLCQKTVMQCCSVNRCDECVLLTTHRGKQGAGKREGLVKVLRKIQELISRPIDIGGAVVSVTCSIGVSIAGEHGATPEGLLRRADEAMYLAKKSGRNQIVFAADDEPKRSPNTEV